MADDAKIDIEEGQKFDVPEVQTSLQAITLIWQGMAFLLTNYRKTVLATLAVIVLLISQFFTNFEQVKKLVGMFGL